MQRNIQDQSASSPKYQFLFIGGSYDGHVREEDAGLKEIHLPIMLEKPKLILEATALKSPRATVIRHEKYVLGKFHVQGTDFLFYKVDGMELRDVVAALMAGYMKVKT
jgi:hypothetical protein